MALNRILITSSLVLCSIAWAGPDNVGHKAVHGGVLATVKDIDYELVANTSTLRLYVRDHGKTVDVSKASAKLTLLSGTEKQEVELKPSGDRLEATGSFKVSAGTKVAAIITSGGKQTAARFVVR